MDYWKNCELAANKAVKTISKMIPKHPRQIAGYTYVCPICGVGVFYKTETCIWCKQTLIWKKEKNKV